MRKQTDDQPVSRQRILAVASGGGHWVQLRRLSPSFQDHHVAYVTVTPAERATTGRDRCYIVRDATRWDRLGLVIMTLQILWIILRERPTVLVSTGAAPGYVALRIGKLFGARTIWLDSIANVEEMSMSGRKIGPQADAWLTQWPELARPDGPYYVGAVL